MNSSDWISTDIELPLLDEDVLLYRVDRRTEENETDIIIGYLWGKKNGIPDWRISIGGEDIEFFPGIEVTHWMVLTPPKGRRFIVGDDSAFIPDSFYEGLKHLGFPFPFKKTEV